MPLVKITKEERKKPSEKKVENNNEQVGGITK
jgi:hypothetical protein